MFFSATFPSSFSHSFSPPTEQRTHRKTKKKTHHAILITNTITMTWAAVAAPHFLPFPFQFLWQYLCFSVLMLIYILIFIHSNEQHNQNQGEGRSLRRRIWENLQLHLHQKYNRKAPRELHGSRGACISPYLISSESSDLYFSESSNVVGYKFIIPTRCWASYLTDFAS